MTELLERARRLGIIGPEVITAILLLSTAIIFGGSSRPSIGNLLVQLAALAALSYLFVRRRLSLPRGGMAGVAFWLMMAIAAVPLLYSVPLPPALWSLLPGRDVALRTYSVTGIAPPWHGIGLRGGVGLMTALHMLAPIAVFLIVYRFTNAQRWALVYGFLTVVLLAIVVGFAQVPGGNSHAFHFYDISSIDGALGFFPNRNHMATLMLCTIPLAVVGALVWMRDRGDGPRLLALAGTILFGLAVVGLVATSARAGLVLAGPVLIGCALLARLAAIRSVSSKVHPAAIWGAIAIAVAIIGVSLAYGSLGNKLVDRVKTHGIVDSDRVEFAKLTAAAIPTYLPVGSGPATFRPVYAMVEPLEQLRPYFINHAHDDYLEIVLEYGVPGALLLLAALTWLALAIGRAWFSGGAFDQPIRCAATIGIVAILLHSTFDYPVRTTTIAVILAMLAALTLASEPAPVVADNPKRGKRRQRIRIA